MRVQVLDLQAWIREWLFKPVLSFNHPVSHQHDTHLIISYSTIRQQIGVRVPTWSVTCTVDFLHFHWISSQNLRLKFGRYISTNLFTENLSGLQFLFAMSLVNAALQCGGFASLWRKFWVIVLFWWKNKKGKLFSCFNQDVSQNVKWLILAWYSIGDSRVVGWDEVNQAAKWGCCFRWYSYSPFGRSSGIPNGVEASKQKNICEGKWHVLEQDNRHKNSALGATPI